MEVNCETVEDRFFDADEQIAPKVSSEDLHSNPSSATLTNISSSTSNQYQPSDDRPQYNKSDVHLQFNNFFSRNTRISSNESPHPDSSKLENLSCLSKEELIEIVCRLNATIGQRETNGKYLFYIAIAIIFVTGSEA